MIIPKIIGYTEIYAPIALKVWVIEYLASRKFSAKLVAPVPILKLRLRGSDSVSATGPVL